MFPQKNTAPGFRDKVRSVKKMKKVVRQHMQQPGFRGRALFTTQQALETGWKPVVNWGDPALICFRTSQCRGEHLSKCDRQFLSLQALASRPWGLERSFRCGRLWQKATSVRNQTVYLAHVAQCSFPNSLTGSCCPMLFSICLPRLHIYSSSELTVAEVPFWILLDF